MSYNSKIDLKLGEQPKTTDVEIFPDMVEIYNAIHILVQYTDKLADALTSGDNTKKPWESMPFRRWFFSTAAVSITKGSIVTPVSLPDIMDEHGDNKQSLTGVVNGGSTLNVYTWSPNDGYINGSQVCFAMNDAEPGDLVQCGVGPAVVQLPETAPGDRFYVRPCALSGWSHDPYEFLINDGRLYKYMGSNMPQPGRDGKGPHFLVGCGVAVDAMLFNPYMYPQQIQPSPPLIIDAHESTANNN